MACKFAFSCILGHSLLRFWHFPAVRVLDVCAVQCRW